MTETKAFTEEEILTVLGNPLTREFFDSQVSSFFITVLPADVSDTFEGHEYDITLVRLFSGGWMVEDRLSKYDADGNRKGDSLFSADRCAHVLEDAVRLAFKVAPSVFVWNMLPVDFPAWYRERANSVKI